MALAGQTITIVNQSGKIVKSSKHIFNVFNEAKSAYNERKAELKAQRECELIVQEQERKARRQLEALHLDNDDTRSKASSKGRSESGRSGQRKTRSVHSSSRPPVARGVSDSIYADDAPTPRTHQRTSRPSPLRQDSTQSPEQFDDPRIKELTRRHTDGMALTSSTRDRFGRRSSFDEIDMDLAYGDMPPALPARKYDDEIELRSKMTGLQRLLDECNCVQHSVLATIDNLQKNPEALAAVALTLGEISNIAMKMAPGTLTALKGSFPAIIALLASPQFAIAAGVGVGVTIIALGGYKIIKKIQAKNEESRQIENPAPVRQIAETSDEAVEEAEAVDELREISSIEKWRRGIADAEADSLGTSVDGEFITPQATRTLVEEGRLTEADLKPPASVTSKRSHRTRKAKSTVSSKSRGRSSAKTKTQKEPSGLKMLFMGRSA